MAKELLEFNAIDFDEANLIIMHSDGDKDALVALQQLRMLKNEV